MALRAACLSLAKASLLPSPVFDPNSPELIKSLEQVLTNVPDTLSQEVGDFIYLPLQHLLQKEAIPDSASRLLLLILARLFESSWTCDSSKCSQLVSVATYLVSPGPPGDIEAFLKKPEDLHEASFQALGAIFANSQIPESPALAHVITILLTSLEVDKELQTQLAALNALIMLFSHILVSPDPKALVLPGTISKLMNFVGQKYGRRHRLAKESALKVMELVICGCMADSLPESKVRSDSWRAASAHQLARSLAVVQRLLQEAQFSSTISAIFQFSKALVSLCSKNLEKECIPTVLDLILFCGAQSRCLEVQKDSRNFIHKLPTDTMTEAAYSLLDRLPSALASQDDARPIRLIEALAECARSLSTSKVMDTLECSVEVSLLASPAGPPPSQLLVGDAAHSDVLLNHVGIKTPLTSSTQRAISSLVSRLDPVEALRWLLDRLPEQGPLASTRLLWFGSAIVKEHKSAQDYFDLLVNCYDLLDTPSAAMACHVLGDIALSSTFTPEFLVDGLFPVFRLLGSSSELTRAQARFALCQFAASQNQTLVDLINTNKDYIVDGISRQINSLDITLTTPLSLAALIDLGGSTVIPYLDDIVDSLFTLLDLYHGYSQLVQGILLVFKTIVKAAGRYSLPSLEPPRRRLHIGSYTALLQELERKPHVDPSILKNPIDLDSAKHPEERVDEDAPNEEPEEGIDPPDDNHEEWDSPVPQDVYRMLERIVKYCDLLMTHDLAEIRLITLEILRLTVPSLATSTRNFLPLVHRIWPQVMSRAQDPETYVVEAALHLIAMLSEYSGDFVQSRVDKLWKILIENRPGLYRKSWPPFSPERRVSNAIAQCIQVWLRLPPSPETVEFMASILRPSFQRGDYPKLYLEFSRLYGDLLWTVMLDLPLQAKTEKLLDIEPSYIT